MPYKKLIVVKIVWFCKGVIIPVILALSLFWFYVKCFCYFSSKSSNADLVCSLNWKDGLFLVISYSVVKVFSPLLNFDTVFKRFIVTLFVYSFSYALFAWPFWFASFFQDFGRNTFLHISGLILAVELIFRSYSKEPTS